MQGLQTFVTLQLTLIGHPEPTTSELLTKNNSATAACLCLPHICACHMFNSNIPKVFSFLEFKVNAALTSPKLLSIS